LISCLEKRISHVQDILKISRAEAISYIQKADASKAKYLKSHFFKEPSDETLYHLIINTGKLNYDESAEIIANAVIKKFSKCFNL
jgi:cytidylate kinase